MSQEQVQALASQVRILEQAVAQVASSNNRPQLDSIQCQLDQLQGSLIVLVGRVQSLEDEVYANRSSSSSQHSFVDTF